MHSLRGHRRLLVIMRERLKQNVLVESPRYPFRKMVSSGLLEVQTMINPSRDGFRRLLESFSPNMIFFLAEPVGSGVTSLVWGGIDLSNAEAVTSLFGSTLLTTVYLEGQSGEKLAKALHSKVPCVIYWKIGFCHSAARHFRHAFFSILQSSSAHTWDAFRLAHASFRLYCVPNNLVCNRSQILSYTLGPCLLGNPPKIDVAAVVLNAGEDEVSSPGYLHAVEIHDEEVSARFLVFGGPSTLDAFWLRSLEDGLNALLSIEIRGSVLHNRFSAPPPLRPGTISHGVVTVQCELVTSSSAHISLLVSGSAQTCYYDRLLESHIKNKVIKKSRLVHALPNEGSRPVFWESPLACGKRVFDVYMNVPRWALQVFEQLARDVSFRSLVFLGIAGIQGVLLASFKKNDARCLLSSCSWHRKDLCPDNVNSSSASTSLRPFALSSKRSEPCQETCSASHTSVTKRLKVAEMRPIPHIHHHSKFPITGICEEDGDHGAHKSTTPVNPYTQNRIERSNSAAHQKFYSSSDELRQSVSPDPLPLKNHDCGRGPIEDCSEEEFLKNHDCGRGPIEDCSEEEFLKDVMDFLILREHRRLIPLGGLAEFPVAKLNAKRLDLYNLYKGVVSRGGFQAANRINWTRQVFSKMGNCTSTNKKSELNLGRDFSCFHPNCRQFFKTSWRAQAHVDVVRERCCSCLSSAAGDFVKCRICEQCFHFGCDKRQGLGPFENYARASGRKYTCPICTLQKKLQKQQNGLFQDLEVPEPVHSSASV